MSTEQQRRATAVEYGLMIAALAAVIVTLVFLFGGSRMNTAPVENDVAATHVADEPPSTK